MVTAGEKTCGPSRVVGMLTAAYLRPDGQLLLTKHDQCDCLAMLWPLETELLEEKCRRCTVRDGVLTDETVREIQELTASSQKVTAEAMELWMRRRTESEWYGRWYVMGEDRFPGVRDIETQMRSISQMIARMERNVVNGNKLTIGKLEERVGDQFGAKHYVRTSTFEFGFRKVDKKKGKYRPVYCRLNPKVAGQPFPSAAAICDAFLTSRSIALISSVEASSSVGSSDLA